MGGALGVVYVSASLVRVPRIGSLLWFAATLTGLNAIAMVGWIIMSNENPTDAAPSDASGQLDGSPSPTSLDGVWQTFGSQLRRRARTRLRQYGLTGQTESMDICNEVMVDLAKRTDAERLTADDVLSYILRAIDNEVIDTFRTMARHCRDFRRNEATPVEDIKLRGEQTSPSQIALRNEVADRVRSILGDSDAVAIDMMLENRDWNEIGRRLGVKADTARMRVRRALDRARNEIDPQGSG